jgi:hypothetical protein
MSCDLIVLSRYALKQLVHYDVIDFILNDYVLKQLVHFGVMSSSCIE